MKCVEELWMFFNYLVWRRSETFDLKLFEHFIVCRQRKSVRRAMFWSRARSTSKVIYAANSMLTSSSAVWRAREDKRSYQKNKFLHFPFFETQLEADNLLRAIRSLSLSPGPLWRRDHGLQPQEYHRCAGRRDWSFHCQGILPQKDKT